MHSPVVHHGLTLLSHYEFNGYVYMHSNTLILTQLRPYSE